jgi:hypothetical protein
MGRPPEFLQPLAQGRNACLSVRIVRSQHYYGEAPHTLGLLHPRCERPSCRCAPKQRDELAALHSINAYTRSAACGEIHLPVQAPTKYELDSALGGRPFLDLGLCLLAARAVEHEQFWKTGHVSDRLDELHGLAAVGAQRRS